MGLGLLRWTMEQHQRDHRRHFYHIINTDYNNKQQQDIAVHHKSQQQQEEEEEEQGIDSIFRETEKRQLKDLKGCRVQ